MHDADTQQSLISKPSLAEAVTVYARVGCISFGGPAGQIAIMHQDLVEEKRWISDRRFLHALNYCMLLPGPEAQQLATYLGWLLHGKWGGFAAGALCIWLVMLAANACFNFTHGKILLASVGNAVSFPLCTQNDTGLLLLYRFLYVFAIFNV